MNIASKHDIRLVTGEGALDLSWQMTGINWWRLIRPSGFMQTTDWARLRATLGYRVRHQILLQEMN